MTIGDESLDEPDEVNELPFYDELFEVFKELHNDLRKISLKNASLKLKMLEFSNENDSLRKQKNSLNENICLRIENKILYDKII